MDLDKTLEARMDLAFKACSRGLAQLRVRQEAFRRARLQARLGVATPVVQAELREALARREQPA
jgi:hypothetical protein